MPIKTHTARMTFAATRFAAFGALLLVPLGCASIQQRTDLTAQSNTAAAPTTTAVAATDMQEIWSNLWPAPMMLAQQGPGPSLVAGDWLAWQCAYTSGYFEMESDAVAAIIIDD